MARHRGMQEETIIAAKYTLAHPLIPSWFKEIELINAGDLLSLLTYHSKCGDAVYNLRLDLSWIESYYGSSEACSWLSGRGSCGCRNSATSRYLVFSSYYSSPQQWWEDFMEEAFEILRDKPFKTAVHACAEKTIQAVKASGCQHCSPKITEDMRDFLDLLERKIEETVSQASRRVNIPLDLVDLLDRLNWN